MDKYRFDYVCQGCYTKRTVRETTDDQAMPGEEPKGVDVCCIGKKLIISEVWKQAG